MSDMQNRSEDHGAQEGNEEWWTVWMNEPAQGNPQESVKLEHARKFEKVEKQGFFNRAWKSRWLALYENMLAYYDAPSDSNLKGTISLQHAIVRQFTDKGHGGFEVVVPGRTYRFRTEDSRIAQSWQDEIDKYSNCSVMQTNAIPHTLSSQRKKLRLSSRIPFLSGRIRSSNMDSSE
eukprot:c11235_g1_i1.p1 GENE.c11235_g1_i1~~c11235_g1_i1.p1  ORF type:complete len:177 (+),score=39.36 c11235_g1_i1:100-630(+)